MIYNNLDRSKPIIVTFLDLAKAFDTVNHEILLDKLYNYGIRGNANQLLRSYLTDRQQLVKIQETKSETCKITTGVPQGTVLGPLLFVLYINDLLCNLPNDTIVSYADDTAIIFRGNTWQATQDKMNNYLLQVNKWLAWNKLTLNVEKTVFMPFGNYKDSIPNSLEIKICNNRIKRVENYKYLGIIFDSNVKWDKHIESVLKKTKYLTFIFSKLANIMQTKTLLTIYYALFNSLISYGIIAWGGAYRNNLRALQSLQNRILKIIYKNTFDANNRPLNIEQLFALESLLYHYKDLKNDYKEQSINTRKKSLQIPKITKKISEKNSYIVAIRLFNLLPKELKTIENSNITIKKKLKNWIKSNI